MRAGNPGQQGATPTDGGVNFALYSSVARRVELCLFDAAGNETRFDLPECTDDIWHGFLPGCKPGQRYGFRVHGDYDPKTGARCNPHKLLIDPYAKSLTGAFSWNPAVFDHDKETYEASIVDSAAYIPKSVVTAPDENPIAPSPRIPWADTIFYEANVRSFTMRHPDIDADARGRFDGMRSGAVLEHLKSLGITSLELMPVQAFIDEHHLARKGLRNLWGYNTVGFFAPMPRYGFEDPVQEFRDMVNAIHDAGIEVILDVAYNHTGESDGFGPTLSFRGIDNLAYYRTLPDDPSAYINDTGTGNTINADHPQVQRIVVDSLRYWVTEMGVDGFRFDLAPILGRHADGFSPTHPLLQAITHDTVMQRVKLIAEPWDPGPGGYQLGQFPREWAEWNDQFRDTTRRFWRGDHGVSGELARRIHGSADIFDSDGRMPATSVNLVTAHDGFSLADVVSYEQRHNEANGEGNRDGHAHNFSCNHGVEGPTDDPGILEARRAHRLNMLATMIFSQGTPLLLAGDEIGHTQHGNNNAYAQDNELAWVDWSKADEDPAFTDQVREMTRLRRELPLLRQSRYLHGQVETDTSVINIDWLDINGEPMDDHAWTDASIFAVAYSYEHIGEDQAFAMLLINRGRRPARLSLPEWVNGNAWHIAFVTQGKALAIDDRTVGVPPHSVALIRDGKPD
ncbi:MAG: glycogen debranching protein GlgX [Woeseiaceae bacterium]|nr:glycogen debranching protein GlgX [Woeseiaceae bacterium]